VFRVGHERGNSIVRKSTNYVNTSISETLPPASFRDPGQAAIHRFQTTTATIPNKKTPPWRGLGSCVTSFSASMWPGVAVIYRAGKVLTLKIRPYRASHKKSSYPTNRAVAIDRCERVRPVAS